MPESFWLVVCEREVHFFFGWNRCAETRLKPQFHVWTYDSISIARTSCILNKFQSQNWIAKTQTFASFETQTVGNFWGPEHHGQGIGLFTWCCNHDGHHQHRKSFNTRTESDKSPTLFVVRFSRTATVGPIINEEVLFLGTSQFSIFGDVYFMYFGWWKSSNFSCVHLREQVSF